jgi:guanylate kinase
MCEAGKMIVVSGPSGAGKSTVLSRVICENPELVFSISATTRAPREGEQDGVNYFFVDMDRFRQMIDQGELYEYACYVDNFYGTPKAPVIQNISRGLDVLFDIEVQGAAQLRARCPEAVFIFIIPSDFSQIKRRLRGRGSDSEEKIQKRIQTARFEYEMARNYDYIVINDDPDVAASEVRAIITAEKCKTASRQKYLTEVFSK